MGTERCARRSIPGTDAHVLPRFSRSWVQQMDLRACFNDSWTWALLLYDGFQPLRPVGKALDGELVVLRARSGPVTSSNRLRHPCGHAPYLRLAGPLKAEFHRITQVAGYEKGASI